MGMFDNVRCRLPIPGFSLPDKDEDFQTKDLGNHLDTYIIAPDGRLTDERGFMIEFTGVLHFYRTDGRFYSGFDAHFDKGRLQHLVLAGDTTNRSAYEAGYKARADGYQPQHNPYSADGNAESWQEGWLSHQEDHP